ncbi:succinate dehydrogenase cytochrome b560 subunit, mitochondrial [Manduca sexta]|uniref:succinate dehydrogenase cytochrome b560 subunit, mitochondrial n=1 Tax=Manduca sexta TaxID=7130 RepID=UPI00188E3FE0|nr:succinate dehydrogenase cytochrome b560 subunit, mitochondrial [Manduca sexta]
MYRLYYGNVSLLRQRSPNDYFCSRGVRLRGVLPNTKISSCVLSEHVRHKHQLSFKPYVPPCYTDHDQKNMTLKRPMSPHLTIYAPTLPAMTSILQRITGSILTFYALLLSGGTLFLSNGVETYVTIIQSLDLSRMSLFVIKILLGAPFCFHYCNGMRYCMWTLGKMLAMKDVYDTSYKSMVAAAVLSILFALL